MNADESHITWRQEVSQTDGQVQFMGEEQREDNAMTKKAVIQKKFTPMTVLVKHTKQQQQNLQKPKVVSVQLIQLRIYWRRLSPHGAVSVNLHSAAWGPGSDGDGDH